MNFDEIVKRLIRSILVAAVIGETALAAMDVDLKTIGSPSQHQWFDLSNKCASAGSTSKIIQNLKAMIKKERLTGCQLHESKTKDGHGLHLNCDQAFQMFASPKSNCFRFLKALKSRTEK